VAGFETLRILAVTTAKRLDVLPDVRTIGEFLPGYEGSGWQGIVATRNTPAAHEQDRDFHLALNEALRRARIRHRNARLGAHGLERPLVRLAGNVGPGQARCGYANRQLSDHCGDALLGIRVGRGRWLRRQLKDGCLLTLAQVCQQFGPPIRKFERIVM
jgi:hypothetical protein